MDLIALQAKWRGLDLVLDIDDPALPTKIFNDENRFKQVVMNLLGNALKFTQKGRITLSLSIKHKDYLHVNVADTGNLIMTMSLNFLLGIGIKSGDFDKLFKLFGKSQEEDSLNLNRNGVGLGLTISNSLVKLMGAFKSKGFF